MKHIHFVTLGRSDYASLRPVALAAVKDEDIEVVMIAGGSHMLEKFGMTIDKIKQDGFEPAHIADYLNDDDSDEGDMAKAYARAVQNFVDIWRHDAPDLIFIVGDRWEMMAVVTAASMLRIPVAHHSGGDITQGSSDNQTRYLLTTLSHIHFTALEEHSRRLIAMGEEAWRVSTTGEPALSMLYDVKAEKSAKPFVLATFHPTTYDPISFDAQAQLFIQALDLIRQNIILTAPAPDAGNENFLQQLKKYAENSLHVRMVENFGDAYYEAMAQASFMIGNSSSGLWEAPSFGLPVVNIGSRQDGRIRGGNVIDVPLEIGAIGSAIEKAGSAIFKLSLSKDNPYVQPDTVERIIAGLKTDKSKSQLLAKVFVDPLQRQR